MTPVGVFVASRAAVLLAVGAAVEVGGPLPSHRYAGPWPDPPAGPKFLQALGSWDASWYLSIARHGYFPASSHSVATEPDVAFFPLWPELIRLVGRFTGASLLDVAVVLAGLSGIAACCVVWALARHLCGPSVADRSAAAWAFFPGSLVLSMGYAEGLTIIGAGLCLLGLLRRRWLLAGAAAAVATSAQPEALVLVACCAWAAAGALRRDRDRRSLVAPVLAAAGAGSYFAYLAARTGDWLRWYHVERHDWGSGLGFGHGTVGALRQTFRGAPVLDSVALTLGLLVVVAGVAAMVRWRPPAVVWIYALGVVALALGSDQVGARSRVLLVAFPLLIGLARGAGPRWSAALTGVFGTLLGAMTLVVLSAVLISP